MWVVVLVSGKETGFKILRVEKSHDKFITEETQKGGEGGEAALLKCSTSYDHSGVCVSRDGEESSGTLLTFSSARL